MVFWIRRRAFLCACIACFLLVAAIRGPSLPQFFPTPHRPGSAAAIASAALDRVTRIPHRVRVLGYERSAFGAGWADTVDTDGEYLDTRDLVMKRSRTSPFDASSVRDGYTGATLAPNEMDIDHVFPLAAAWDFGAWSWPPAQRQSFANDVSLNLIPTASELNREKSDSTLSEWQPPDPDRQCDYAARFLTVAETYHLAISVADAEVAVNVCRLDGA